MGGCLLRMGPGLGLGPWLLGLLGVGIPRRCGLGIVVCLGVRSRRHRLHWAGWWAPARLLGGRCVPLWRGLLLLLLLLLLPVCCRWVRYGGGVRGNVGRGPRGGLLSRWLWLGCLGHPILRRLLGRCVLRLLKEAEPLLCCIVGV
jgi:hypothetical protein